MRLKAQFSGLLVAALALAGVAGTSTRADAAFVAYICDDALCTGGNDTIVTDQGAGDNIPGSLVLGQINGGALNVGGFMISSNTAQSKPLLGSASAPQLDLAFTATTIDNATHTLWLYASDTDFVGAHSFNLSLGGTQPPTGAGNSVTASAWGGNSNSNLNLSNLLVSLGPTAGTPFALAAAGLLNPTASPYALTLGVVITRTGAGTTTGNLNFSVPEPASMALFGLGLAAAGVLRRRKAAQTK